MMHHISAEPPPFFHRGPSPAARLAFFGLLSLALMFADTRFKYLEGIRQVTSVMLYPLQRAVQLPGEALVWTGAYFSSKRALTDENAALKADLVAHSLSTQEFSRLQAENGNLRGLLDLTRRNRLLNHRPKGRSTLRIVDEIRRTFGSILHHVGDQSFSCTFSAGISVLAGNEDGRSTDRLVADADAALYRAKRGGRDMVKLAETPRRKAR